MLYSVQGKILNSKNGETSSCRKIDSDEESNILYGCYLRIIADMLDFLVTARQLKISLWRTWMLSRIMSMA